MKIWILFDFPLPHDGVNALQVMKTAEALTRINRDTTLIVPLRNNERDISTEEIHAVYGMSPSVQIQKVPCLGGRLGALRIEKWAHPLSVLRKTASRPDLILTRNIPSAILTTRQGIPTFVETFRAARGKNALLRTIFRRLHRSPSLRGIVTHSEKCAETLREGTPHLEKIVTIHNGCDASLLQTALSPPEDRAGNRVIERRTVLYAGHLRADKGIDLLFHMAARLPEVQFMLVGFRDAAQEHQLKSHADRRGLSNLVLHRWVHQGDLVSLLFAADLAIIPPTERPFRSGDTGLPLKTFDYLGSGLPVMAPDVDDVKPLLHHGKNSWLVPPDNLDAATEAVRALLSTPELLSRLSVGARETAANYTWDLRAQRLMALFQSRS